MPAYVYIMASKRNGTLYTGVTTDIAQRAYEHREGLLPGFTRKYGCRILVWYEEHFDVRDAIQREKSIKRYYRKWKLNLIEEINPDWRDLYDEVGLCGRWSFLAPLSSSHPRACPEDLARHVSQQAFWVLGTSPRMTRCGKRAPYPHLTSPNIADPA